MIYNILCSLVPVLFPLFLHLFFPPPSKKAPLLLFRIRPPRRHALPDIMAWSWFSQDCQQIAFPQIVFAFPQNTFHTSGHCVSPGGM